MSSKPKQTAQQKELERISIEREKQLRVENARETTKAFSDNLAFRKKLRGIFSLLSAGFKGFPTGLGVSGAGGGGGSRGGGSGGSSGMGTSGGGTRSGRGSGGSSSGSGGGSGGGSPRGGRSPKGYNRFLD